MSENIIIVGGASGIGKSTTEEYLKQNKNVIVFDVSEKHLRTMKEMRALYKNSLLLIQGDVRKIKDIHNAIKQTESLFGKVNILIYSAGIFPDHPILNMEEHDWDNVLDINLKGAFLFMQTVAKQMVENKISGQIITISSGSYRSAREGSAHYCSSKAGLVMLTKVMAMELARYNINVNSIAPGLIDNPILDPSYKESFTNRIPKGRIGQPNDVASFIVNFTELNNDYLTGQVLSIDGGLSTGQFGLSMSNNLST